MKNKDQQSNYKVFIPVGITFIGAGVTFLIAVNSMVGVGMVAVGGAFVIIGAKKSRE